MDLSSSWEDADFQKQWEIANGELSKLKAGSISPVFGSLFSLMNNYIKEKGTLTFLDCACTSGYYLDAMRHELKHDLVYTGSDLAESAVQIARSRHPDVMWHVASVTSLPFDTKSFDIVMAAGLLEHVPDWRTAIGEITRVASRYVIFHRLPISPTGKFVDGKMEMYGIPTSRFSFPFHEVVSMLQDKDFLLINSIDTYHTHSIPEQTVLFKHRSFL